jgi:cell division protein FtsN
MSTRESRRLKEKRSMIPFGDIMLPVIGLVAVGLLIVGVKLFFLSGPKTPGYLPMSPSEPSRQQEAPPAAQPVKKAPPASQARPAVQSPAPAAANSRWGVQIGSFTARDGAETVRQQAAKAGFSSVISSALVNRKTYYRVTVPAGNNRPQADDLAERLKKAGFPVFVVGMR